MRKEFLAAIIALLSLPIESCTSPGNYLGQDSIEIHIENQTETDLNAVRVFVVQSTLINGKYQETRTDSSHIGPIEPTKTAVGILYEKNIQGVDGSYLLTATGQNGKTYHERFGYLTNGSFLDTEQYIIVKKDSIILRR